MMQFNVIRRFFDEDEYCLNSRAKKFCERHGLSIVDDWRELDSLLDAAANTNWDNSRYLLKLWRRCMNRALGVDAGIRVGVAYDNVGYFVK